MFSFSKPRLISIGLLLAILLISLMIPSYVEGLENKQVAEIMEKVNENAPKSNGATGSTVATGNTVATGSNGITGSTNKPTGIALGKPLTVDDITGALQNNPGVQKMLDKPL
jgi:hypothetical protein